MKKGIYKIENKINGKVYVGSGIIEDRFYDHKRELSGGFHSNEHLQNSWKKHGKENFKFEVLIYCNEDNLGFYEERAIVDVYESYKRENGYNFRKGRDSAEFTEEVGNKISKSLRDYYKNNDSSMKGETYSEEVKRKMSECKKGKNNPSWGTKHSEEHRNKISKSLKEYYKKNEHPMTGRERSEEVKKKIKENHAQLSDEEHPMKGFEHSEEAKQKISKANSGENNTQSKLNKKQVRNIKDMLNNSSKKQKEIASYYNVSTALISSIETGRLWEDVEVGS